MKKIILFNLIIIFFLSFILELTARIFHLSDLMGTDANLYLQREMKKKNSYFHVLKPNLEAKIFNERFFTDDYGYRVPFLNYKYTEENDTVFFIGDSTTFGNGILEEGTFVGLLRNKFTSINFINSSVPGYNIPQIMEMLESTANFKNVKKVFYIYTLNDISNISTDQETNLEQKRVNKFRDIKITKKINNFFRDKSFFYMWFKGKLTDPSARYFKYDYNAYKVKSNIDLLELSLEKIKAHFSKNNIDFKIILLPYEFQTRENNCYNEYIYPQKVVSRIVKKFDINFSDYTKNFCEHANPKKLFYKFDPMHLSYEGHKFVYSILKDEIKI